MWVDTHCHLQLAEAEPEVSLRRAAAAGVDWVMVPGVDAASSEAARRLAAGDQRVKWSAGLHPHDAGRWPEQAEQIAALTAQADAVGEIGLDFYRSLTPRRIQVEVFRAQIALAAEHRLPIIVHCRDAFATVFEIVENAGVGPQTILHCWTAGPRWTRRFRDLGVTFSYAGPLAFDNGDTIRRGAVEAPPDRTVIETDTPLLTPPPFRSEENQPSRVVLVGEALAGVWGVEAAEVARLTTLAAERVFGG